MGGAWEDLGIPKLAGELTGAVYAGSDITPAVERLLNTKLAWLPLVSPYLDDPARTRAADGLTGAERALPQAIAAAWDRLRGAPPPQEQQQQEAGSDTSRWLAAIAADLAIAEAEPPHGRRLRTATGPHHHRLHRPRPRSRSPATPRPSR